MSFFKPFTPDVVEQYGGGSGNNSHDTNDNTIPYYSSSSSSSSSSDEDFDGQGQYHTGSDVGSDADTALPKAHLPPHLRLFDQKPRPFVANMGISPGAVGVQQRDDSMLLVHNRHAEYKDPRHPNNNTNNMMDLSDLGESDKELLAMMDKDVDVERPNSEGFTPPKESRLDRDTSLVDKLQLGQKSLGEIDRIEENLLHDTIRMSLIEVNAALVRDMQAEYETDRFHKLHLNPYSRYKTRVYSSELLILERRIETLFELLDKVAKEEERRERESKSQRASPLGNFKHISLSSSPLDTTRLSPLSFGSALTGRSATPDWIPSNFTGESPASARHNMSKSSSSNSSNSIDSIDSNSFTPAPLRTTPMIASRSTDSASSSSITLPSIQVIQAVDDKYAAQTRVASDMYGGSNRDGNGSNSNNNNCSAEETADSLKEQLTKALDQYVRWIKLDYNVDICICHRYHRCHHNPLDDTSCRITQARVAAYEAYSQVKACREERVRRWQQLQPHARRSPPFFYTTSQLQERETAAKEQGAVENAKWEDRLSVPYILNKSESGI